MSKKWKKTALSILLILALSLSACLQTELQQTSYSQEEAGKNNPLEAPERTKQGKNPADSSEDISLTNIPAYSGSAYVPLNGNIPEFSETEYSRDSFETYSDLDSLGRCGTAFANIGPDLMPKGKRESINQIKPSGWQSVKYDFVDGKYLYNRCHLIGYQLAGENANEKNLITGTRYLNVDGMLPFENMVADYVKETGNHVLYRVTPRFEGDNLIANGLQMEALSMEDNGEGICFHVYVYNHQPDIMIDYATGDSTAAKDGTLPNASAQVAEYVLNTNTKKFHAVSCASADDMKESNKEIYHGERAKLLEQGYEPCSRCKP